MIAKCAIQSAANLSATKRKKNVMDKGKWIMVAIIFAAVIVANVVTYVATRKIKKLAEL